MATVYLGYEGKKPAERVAIRRIEHTKGVWMQRQEVVALELQKRLGGLHPNILEVHHIMETSAGDVLSISPYMSGGEFFSFMASMQKAQQLVPEALAGAYARVILDTVAFMHSQNIMHRDIKPENILWHDALGEDAALAVPGVRTPDPRGIKIGDFGFALLLPVGQKSMDRRGTPPYMAPEICGKIGYGHNVDCWATVVTIFAVLSEEFPFGCDRAVIVTGQIDQGSCYKRVMSKPMQTFFETYFRTHVQDPEYYTPQRLIEFLEQQLAQTELEAQADSPIFVLELKEDGAEVETDVRMPTAPAQYVAGRLLGSGAVAAVYFGHEKGKPDHPLALRITPHTLRAEIVKADLQGLFLQKDLPDHPGILKLVNLGRLPNQDILSIFPLMSGGELYEFIAKVERRRGVVSDELACRCFRRWTEAVAFLHSQGITHRDIKPENILVGVYLAANSPYAVPFIETPDPDSLKLSDFGFAKRFTPGEKHTAPCGSPRYQAPEIHDGVYSETVDLWAAAVTLFVFMMQSFPFVDENSDIFLGKISKETGYQARMSPQMQKFFEFVFSKHARENSDHFTAQSLMDTLHVATFDPPRESPVPQLQQDIATPSDRQSGLSSLASCGSPGVRSPTWAAHQALLRKLVRSTQKKHSAL